MRAQNRQRFAVHAAAFGWHRYRQLTGEIFSRERSRICGDFLWRACRNQMAAGFSGAGAKIDHVICAANRFFVVLDYQHGVAQIAQRLKRGKQPPVVARVQADGGLVEHVEHASQARADLGGQANALCFAAG